MFRAAILLISLLILAIPTFAQADKSLQCPIVSITGPYGVVRSGEIETYVLNIENAGNYKFVWTVSEGTIVGGQGTTRLEVRREIVGAITAAVEVTGLPGGCPHVFSETVTVDPAPERELVGELPISFSRLEKRAIDSLIDKLVTNPNAQGFIVLEFAANTSQKTISNYQKKLEFYIASQVHRMDTDRTTIVRSAKSHTNRITLYLVPPGAAPPGQD